MITNKIGLHAGYFAGTELEKDLFEMLRVTAEAGCQAIELMPGCFLGMTMAQKQEVRRALEHLAVSNAIRCASDQALARLGELLAAIADCDSPAQAAEAAWVFQHELALASGNSILPLIYSSFKPPVITLWIRFCKLYGIGALCRNTEKLYNYLCARDQEGAARWIDEYLGRAISGSQQIYSE